MRFYKHHSVFREISLVVIFLVASSCPLFVYIALSAHKGWEWKYFNRKIHASTLINKSMLLNHSVFFILRHFETSLYGRHLSHSWEKVSKALSLWSMAQFTWHPTIKFQTLMLTTIFCLGNNTGLTLINKQAFDMSLPHYPLYVFNFLILPKPKDWIGCAVQVCFIEKKHRKYKQCRYWCKLLEM